MLNRDLMKTGIVNYVFNGGKRPVGTELQIKKAIDVAQEAKEHLSRPRQITLTEVALAMVDAHFWDFWKANLKFIKKQIIELF